MDNQLLKNIIEAALLAAARPMSIKQLRDLFPYRQKPDKSEIREALKSLQENYDNRGIELVEVATGFRIQVRPSMIDWLTKLWEERPPRYSRALIETLALIAYRQPITRGDIEAVRGVAVSTNITRTLMERGWIKIVGHRDVPGKPALYGTTPLFLEYFGLKRLDDLPPLAEIQDLDSVLPQLELGTMEREPQLQVVVGTGDEAVETQSEASDSGGESDNDSGETSQARQDDDGTGDEPETAGEAAVAAESSEDEQAADDTPANERADAAVQN